MVSRSLTATGLCKSFNEQVLFAGLNFKLQTKRLLHVCGENGSGKSSLLRCIAGVSAFDEGELDYGEAGQPPNASHIFYLGHKIGINQQLTAWEHCYYALHRPASHQEQLVKETLRDLRLNHVCHQPAYQLSRGQKQRTALAVLAWIKQPIWLLDEPFTALDTLGVAWLMARIEQHLNNGGFVILSTHQNVALPKQHLQTLDMLESVC